MKPCEVYVVPWASYSWRWMCATCEKAGPRVLDKAPAELGGRVHELQQAIA